MKNMFVIMLVAILVISQAQAQVLESVITLNPKKTQQGNFYFKEYLKDRPWIEYNQRFKKLILDHTEGWTGYGYYSLAVHRNDSILRDVISQKSVKSFTLYDFVWVFSQLIQSRKLNDDAVNVFFVRPPKGPIVCVYMYRECPNGDIWHVSATDRPGSFVGSTRYYSTEEYISKTP